MQDVECPAGAAQGEGKQHEGEPLYPLDRTLETLIKIDILYGQKVDMYVNDRVLYV